jgi:hypothetical protein
MSRNNLFDSIAERFDFGSGTLGAARDAELTANFTIPDDGVIAYYFDPTAARDVTLPTYKRGAFHIITHVGAAFVITVKNPLGATIATVAAGESVLLHCSGVEWKSLGGGTGSSFSPTDIASADGSIDVTIVGGTDIDLAVDEANVDHDLLLNFVADKHIDHTAVSISTAANSGLAGGGNISASRSLTVDINNLAADTPVLADSFAFFDASGADTNKATLTALNSILDHGALLGFVANEHVDHSSVSISAGVGLSGGGDLTASRTLSLDIDGLSADTITGADFLAFHDTSGGDVNKITVTNFNASLDHDALINYSANEHIDHTVVSISAGTGLSGGGTIAANRTISLAIDGLVADTPVAADVFAFYDDSGLDHNKVTLANLTTAIISQGNILTTATGQPLDADLTAIAALTTTAYGRSLLTLADEDALEALLDTLPNLTSIQGRTVTLADAGADAVFGWDDSASAYVNLSAADARAAISAQALDATLTALAAYNTNGLLTQTAADTFAGRTITGTANQITVADGNGVAGNPTLSLHADVYRAGGTDVALADGGTGASLADPNIDRIMMWDDSAGAVKFGALADINTEATPASGDFLLMYDAAGNLLKTDWNNLPGAAGGIPTEASSTDNAIVRWDGVGGNAVQDSIVTVSDTGVVASATSVLINAASDLFGSTRLQAVADSNNDWCGTFFGYGAGAFAVPFAAAKTRGADASSHTALNDGDGIFSFLSYGSDGTAYRAAADLQFTVDGTVSAGNVPTLFKVRLRSTTGMVDRFTIRSDGSAGVGTSAPDRRLHVEEDNAATNTLVPVARFTVTSTGTPAVGFGPAIELEAETAAGNNEVGVTLGAAITDGTAASEDFDAVIAIMRAGAAASEAFRVSNDWTYATDGQGNKNYMPHTMHLNSQHSISSATQTEVTGLSHTLVAGTYVFEYYLICQAAATATGLTFAINYTGTATKLVAWLTWPDTGVTAALGAVDDVANAATGQVVAHAVARTEATATGNLSTGTAGVATANQNLICKISGVIVVSDGGDLELWHGSETANATSVEVGSSLILTRTN